MFGKTVNFPNFPILLKWIKNCNIKTENNIKRTVILFLLCKNHCLPRRLLISVIKKYLCGGMFYGEMNQTCPHLVYIGIVMPSGSQILRFTVRLSYQLWSLEILPWVVRLVLLPWELDIWSSFKELNSLLYIRELYMRKSGINN